MPPRLENLQYRIVEESPDWWVIDKPAHLLVHPTKPDGRMTLLQLMREAAEGAFVSMVNRLDRETSGLVLAAKSPEAASQLGKMTMRHEIGKRYLALVCGEAPESGEIKAPLGRMGTQGESAIHLKQGVLETGGAEALTRFRCLEKRSSATGIRISLLEVETGTGRLHQIRVHLSHIGFPVVGDKIYGPDENCYLEFIRDGWTPDLQAKLWINRHALHAHELGFCWNGEARFFAVPLPQDLAVFWDSLERGG
jgi:23S rRNA pseudouridine1911/1915/1917 synthase